MSGNVAASGSAAGWAGWAMSGMTSLTSKLVKGKGQQAQKTPNVPAEKPATPGKYYFIHFPIPVSFREFSAIYR